MTERPPRPVRRALLGAPALVLLVAACTGGAAPSLTAGAPTPSTSPAESPATSPTDLASPPAAGETVTVTAVDYQYQGVPATATAGTTFELDNAGAELHEMVVVRRNDDVTTSFEELLAMPQEEVLKFVTIVGNAQAAPGESGTTTVTATEPGDYVMVCFIPTGTTDLSSLGAGPPHVAQGMFATFTVQ